MTGFTDSVNSTYSVHYQPPERSQPPFSPMAAIPNPSHHHHHHQQQQQIAHQPHSTTCSYPDPHTSIPLGAANVGVAVTTGDAYLQSGSGSGGGSGGFDQRALAEIFGAGGSSLETGVVDLGMLGAEMGIPDWFSLEYMPHAPDGGIY